MSLKQKRKLEKAKKFISQNIKASMLVDIVSGTISDVNSGMHADDDMLTPFHSAGQLRSNPQLKGDREFVTHSVAAVAGRVMQKLSMQMEIEPSEMIPLLDLTNAEETKAINQLLNKYQN